MESNQLTANICYVKSLFDFLPSLIAWLTQLLHIKATHFIILLLGTYPKELNIGVQTDTDTLKFTTALFIIA